MPNYIDFHVEDFATDDYFVKWVLDPSQDADLFWSEWVNANPAMEDKVLEAKELVIDLNAIQQEETQVNYAEEIWKNIEDGIKGNNEKPRESSNSTYSILRNIAAVAAMLLVLIGTYYVFNKDITTSSKLGSDLAWVNEQNITNNSKTIVLSDNSTVVLEPYSTLKYPKVFQKDQRIVFLKGEAFFDIKRDTLCPFLVYANETITKVLGTSFKVSAFEGQQSVKVDVISGKVAVYANVKENKDDKKPNQIVINADEKIIIPQPNKKLEITPNQSVVFDMEEAQMIKTVIEMPRILIEKKSDFQFQFTNEPVSKVFDALEYTYGIPFKYDKKKLLDCTITTKLDDEPMLQKVAIICSALNLQHREENATIIIEGVGCIK